MTGSLMQLVAVGKGDEFFLNEKSLFNFDPPKKFSMIGKAMTNGKFEMCDETNFVYIIPRCGDILHNLTIQINGDCGVYDVYDIIDKIELVLNDKIIDSMSGEYMKYHKIIHKQPYKDTKFKDDKNSINNVLTIPKWFDNSYPLLSAGMKNTRIRLKINDKFKDYVTDVLAITEQICLENAERKKLANPPTYLFYGTYKQSSIIKNTNNFVKLKIIDKFRMNYMFFTIKDENQKDIPFKNASLILNGQCYFELLESYYLTAYQEQTLNIKLPEGVYFYSFCLNVNDYQPSGFINGKRIDNIELYINLHMPNKYANITFYANTLDMLKVEDKLRH